MGLSHSPSIITDGIVLMLDAGNIRSYPGSGTSWTDLSGNSLVGTLTNGPTYSSSNGGAIVFDGTNDYVSVPHNDIMNLINNHSISVWFNQTAAVGVWSALLGKGTNDSDEQYCLLLNSTRTYLYYDIGTGSGPYIQPLVSALSLNTWYNIIVTQSRVSSISTLSLYLNGVLQPTSTLSSYITPNTNSNSFTIGVARGTSYPFIGNISSLQIYNRTLTASEILQNYNALRGRFGI